MNFPFSHFAACWSIVVPPLSRIGEHFTTLSLSPSLITIPQLSDEWESDYLICGVHLGRRLDFGYSALLYRKDRPPINPPHTHNNCRGALCLRCSAFAKIQYKFTISLCHTCSRSAPCKLQFTYTRWKLLCPFQVRNSRPVRRLFIMRLVRLYDHKGHRVSRGQWIGCVFYLIIQLQCLSPASVKPSALTAPCKACDSMDQKKAQNSVVSRAMKLDLNHNK